MKDIEFVGLLVLAILHLPFVQNFQKGFINHVAAVGVFEPDDLTANMIAKNKAEIEVIVKRPRGN